MQAGRKLCFPFCDYSGHRLRLPKRISRRRRRVIRPNCDEKRILSPPLRVYLGGDRDSHPPKDLNDPIRMPWPNGLVRNCRLHARVCFLSRRRWPGVINFNLKPRILEDLSDFALVGDRLLIGWGRGHGDLPLRQILQAGRNLFPLFDREMAILRLVDGAGATRRRVRCHPFLSHDKRGKERKGLRSIPFGLTAAPAPEK
jgi:hypothetical protein